MEKSKRKMVLTLLFQDKYTMSQLQWQVFLTHLFLIMNDASLSLFIELPALKLTRESLKCHKIISIFPSGEQAEMGLLWTDMAQDSRLFSGRFTFEEDDNTYQHSIKESKKESNTKEDGDKKL